MSEREKIISIIQAAKYCDTNNRCEECKYDKESENNEDMSCGSLRIADALIAAGIGDVTAHETEAEYWKTICKFWFCSRFSALFFRRTKVVNLSL